MDKFEAVALTPWWTEGTKVRVDKRWPNTYNYSVEITNTDPEIIKIFVEYLKERLDVQTERLKLQLQIHLGTIWNCSKLFGQIKQVSLNLSLIKLLSDLLVTRWERPKEHAKLEFLIRTFI